MCGDALPSAFTSRHFSLSLFTCALRCFCVFPAEYPSVETAERVSWAHAILFMGLFFILVDPLRTMASAGLVGHNE